MLNTSNLNESRVSNLATNRDLLDMDISKIQEHQGKCEEGGRFVEAEMAKQRVSQFKKIENQKLLKELKFNQENKNKQIEEDHKIELDNFNEEMDKKLFDLNEKYEEDQKAIIEAQEKEVGVKTEEFNREYPQQPKNSTEFLNLTKKLEGLVKQKDYTKAHQFQVQVSDLGNVEKEKWDKHRIEKLKKELEKVKTKHENETQFFHKKMNLIFNDFKKTRAIDTEIIVQKYKNKNKGSENSHKCELNEFNRPLRNAIKSGKNRPKSNNKNSTGGFINSGK